MSPLPVTSDMLAVAKRVVWFREPEDTLKDPIHFLCHLMTYTLPEDLGTVLAHIPITDFRQALEQAPAGIFDERSWAYWNVKLGRDPVPPLPQRIIPDAA